MELYNLKTPIRKKRGPRPWVIAALALVAIIAVFITLELTNTTYLLHDRKPAVTANANTKGEVGNTADKSSDSPSTPDGQVPENNNDKSQDASQQLIAPTGDFVSNHHPNLGGSPAPNTMSSVCTTVAGASCTITFTMGDQKKSLQAQTTDRGGSAYWSWRLQDIGLTEGSWTIQAEATLGSQKLSSTDALKLEVAK